MKKLLAILTLTVAALTLHAQQRVLLQNGTPTNDFVYFGTNKVAVLNAVNVTNTFDSASSTTTNLAAYLRARKVFIPTTTLGVAIGGSFPSTAFTNRVGYFFQRSWDATNWLNWTNVEVHSLTTTNSYTNFNFTLGDYHYVRCYDISNSNVGPPASTWRSNYLEIFYK